MRRKQHILIKQLDQKLEPFLAVRQVQVPNRGWVHAIRTALNMTLDQLGSKLNITKQGARKVEESESVGSISLNSLRAVANALEMQLVYALVPKDGSIEDLIKIRAKELAERIVMRTHQNMALEDQGLSDEQIKNAIDELAEEIKREMRRSLWD